jgi:hypothetical protein
MGYKSMSVAFESVDDEYPRPEYARNADSLSELVDDVVQSDFMVDLAMARRCQAIERARAFSEKAARRTYSTGNVNSQIAMAERAFTAELAAALHVPDRTAQSLISVSRTLVNDLPSTLDALADGRLSYRHAQVLVDHSNGLSAPDVRKLEGSVLPAAERMTPSQFDRTVRKTRERLRPESMVERQIKADGERYVAIVPEQEGMAILTAYLPAVQAVAIDARLTEICSGLQNSDETRTLTQLRADVFSDILLDADADTTAEAAGAAGSRPGPTSRFRSIRPRVLVSVPVMTLLRKSAEPANLEGYGPIDSDTARQLTANAPSLQRLLTDPVSGATLAVGRERYRIPEDLKTWLRVRDGTCRFPSCNRNAARCDIDHTNDWAKSGGTDHWNLAHLCPSHHALKHASNWKVEQDPGGSGELRWMSPAGNRYTTTAESEVLATAVRVGATDIL